MVTAFDDGRRLAGASGQGQAGVRVIGFLWACVFVGHGVTTTADELLFESRIRPLLVRVCLDCHNAQRQDGGLRLDSRHAIFEGGRGGPAVDRERPEQSLLVQALRRTSGVCSPLREHFTARQIADVREWVKAGLPWPNGQGGSVTHNHATEIWWSFQPLREVFPEDDFAAGWCKTGIDSFVFSRLEEAGLEVAPQADRQHLLRRATFDLTGLPPHPEEIARFLSDDSPDGYLQVLDRLLAVPSYGQRWARHWLDVVRYADARDLIQLPEGSDFREIWRYRDWVVRALNRDLSYRDFIRYQIAGDLLQPDDPQCMDKDALVATGMLALADFVPGDVDKDLMVADYVDDMINVVGQGVMGLTVACARCHEHKFDPISTEDYYALAGIFFSTSLVDDIPNNPGNTPLVRAELLTPAERERVNQQLAEVDQRAAALDQMINRLAAQSSNFEIVSITWGQAGVTFHRNGVEVGANHNLDAISRDPNIQALKIGGAGSGNSQKFRGFLAELRVFKEQLDPPLRESVEQDLRYRWFGHAKEPLGSRLPDDVSPEAEGSSELSSLDTQPNTDAAPRASVATTGNGEVLRLSADDAELQLNAEGRVVVWPDRAGQEENALPVPGTPVPERVQAQIEGVARPVLAFMGQELLQVPMSAPRVGSVFIVFSKAQGAPAGSRLIGWEDSLVGRHGLGIQTSGAAELLAILRNDGISGDMFSPQYQHFSRDGAGDVSPQNRTKIEQELKELRQQREMVRKEREEKIKQQKLEIPWAVVVQDGGPVGTRHEGVQDARVFVRGNHQDLGPSVRRGFPALLRRPEDPEIQSGSGRRELADWLTRDEHPLTARVIVNRIWQHHFGKGIVSSPNNFGVNGKRPTHPLLLDYLAARFLETDWSIKAIHRHIMSSAAYQQATIFSPTAYARDPENRLLWRMNRRRLEAEALRDAFLAVADQIDLRLEGPGFEAIDNPRRSLYLLTTRTGAKTSGFGALFDGADSSAIVGQRSESTVAPQALFMMNDPFVAAQANALAERIQTEVPRDVWNRKIQRLYEIALTRLPTEKEMEVSLRMLANAVGPTGQQEAWQRLCLVVLCTNEMIYID